VRLVTLGNGNLKDRLWRRAVKWETSKDIGLASDGIYGYWQTYGCK